MNNNLGPRIKELREAMGLSQVDIADRMNVSDRTVSAWENGTRNPKDIIGLADALGVDVSTLLNRSASEVKNNPINASEYLIGSTGSKGKVEMLKVRSFNGYITLTVDGKKGDFMELYASLDRDRKLDVIECMLNDLGITDVDFE